MNGLTGAAPGSLRVCEVWASYWIYAPLTLLLAALIFTGCANFSPMESFAAISQDVKQQTNYQVKWGVLSAPQLQSFLSQPLTVNRAVQLALLNNRRLQSKFEQLGIAQANLVVVGLLPNPSLHASTHFPLGDADSGKVGYTLSVEMDLISILLSPLRTSIQRADVEKSGLRIRAEIIDLIIQAQGAFYRLQANQRLVKINRQIVLAAKAAYDFAQNLYQAGNIPELNLLLHASAYDQAKLSLSRSEIDLSNSQEQLNRYLGLWGGQVEWTIADTPITIPEESAPLEHLEQTAVSNSIDLGLLKQDMIAVRKKLGLTKSSAIFPAFDVGLEFEQDEGHQKVGPEFGFGLPIFNRRQGDKARLQLTLKALGQAHYSLAVDIRSISRTVRNRLLNARSTVQFYQEQLIPTHEKILQEMQLQYNAMQIGAIRLLQAKQQEMKIRRSYVQAYYNYQVAQSEMQQILYGGLPRLETTNVLLESGVDSPTTLKHGGH